MDFKNFYLLAGKDEYKGKVNAFAVTCQTYLETGNYQSILAVKANNYAGIKKTASWTGKIYTIDSPEYINGVKYIKRSAFRAYDNADEFLKDYIAKLQLDRYTDVRVYGIDSYICYFYCIFSGGWATDPNYVKKLVDVSFKLGPILINPINWMDQALKAWKTAQSKYPKFQEWFKDYMDSKFQGMDKPDNTTPITTNKPEAAPAKPAPKKSSKKTMIALDAGHGGKDPGAINHNSNIHEADIALKTVLKMKEILEESGYAVFLTRDKDETVDLDSRGDMINKSDSVLSLSVHCNSSTDDKPVGHEDYFYLFKDKNGKVFTSSKGKKLAECINRAWMEAFPNATNRKIKGQNFAMVRNPKCPSALTEMDFISNDESCKFLSTNIDAMANALVHGILDYLK